MKTQKNTQKNLKRGFTLLELLVIVVIIGILAGIALPQYRKAVAKAELAKIVEITKSIKLAQERYYMANDRYSNKLSALDISLDDPNTSCWVGVESGGWVHCYNENFALWSYMTQTITQCAGKSQDENSPLVNACKELLKGNCKKSYTAATCWVLGLEYCYDCSTNKPIF